MSEGMFAALSVALTAFALAGAVGDVRTKRIPNRLVLAGLVVALVIRAGLGWLSLAHGLGGAALARDGLAAAQSGRSPILAQLLETDGQITAVQVSRAAAAGDPVSNGLIRSGGQRLGSVLASLVSFFNPSMVVIGGQVSRIGHELLAEVRGVVYQRSLPLATENMPIVHSEMEGQGGVVGAARLASDLVFVRDFAR